ncbi:MAG TPA: hypothetical protein VE779_17290 [Candidatus Angelobacter sp.]|nr:hypothetical protein [Candidatus Angelobacter sp.]
MVRVRSVDVISCAKIYGVLNMAMGVLIGLMFVVIGLVGLAAAPGQQKFGLIGVLVIAALSPFVYGAMGFVFGAIGALFYNWVASAIGGIQMELETVPTPYIAPPALPTPAV